MVFIYPRFAMQSKRTLLSWNTDKDSVYSLHLLQSIPTVSLIYLFTTIIQAFERAAMHVIRLKLLKEQASQIGPPLDIIEYPTPL